MANTGFDLAMNRIPRTTGRLLALLIGVLSGWAGLAFGRSAEKDGFPDYTKIEYAKPRPPAEEQIAEPPPGSIKARLGDRQATNMGNSLDELPLPVVTRPKPNETEPSFDDLLGDDTVAKSTGTASSTATANADSQPQKAEFKQDKDLSF
jgi:hypothetical protein